MRISQKLDYANRAVLQLAKSYDGKSVSKLEEISQRENIPQAFLVQILTDLKRAGIVISKRGKAGGYLLAKEPVTISFADVISATEPQLLEETFTFEGDSAAELHRVWGELSAAFKKHASEITFEDLISGEKEPMWFI